VFLASGEDFPDALAGGPAAANQAAPILLSRHAFLPPETVAELQRLAPRRIYILGGVGALSEDVARQAASYTGQVTRLAGVNRYATSVQASKALWTSAEVVFLASGSNYPDALSGGARAAKRGSPVLLSRHEALPPTVRRELKRLQPTRVVLLGGESGLSAAVQKEVKAMMPAVTTGRLSGTDRYATSAAIAQAGWRTSDSVYFAAGTDFPDALAGVPAAAHHRAPLLLTRATCMPAPIADMVHRLAPTKRVLLGGPTVLQDGAATARC
jgi:putative cell wall-binding protein